MDACTQITWDQSVLLPLKRKKHLIGGKHSKKTVWGEKTLLTSPEVQAAVTSKARRDPGRASFYPSH